MRSGVSREEAHRRARLELGGLNTVKDECREARRLQLFDEIGRDVRYAGRALQAMLFHVPAHSLAILAGSASIIAAVALTACLLPAYRAARISPMQALTEP